MSDPLRIVVVGTGVMGANHVRVLKRTAGAELAAVVDADLERARAAASDPAIFCCRSIDELPDDIDAAVVAVPTSGHVETATALIRRGIHLLVEKPLAATVAEAEEITQAAAEAGVVLAVGHIERFNPAIVELSNLVESPIHIAAARIGPYSSRISDGVVFDLMIHDIDIVCALAGEGASVTSVAGVGRAIRSTSEDIANATMTFDNGVTAALATSRLGQQKIRSIEVTQGDSVVTADLVRADITIHRMAHHEFLGDHGVSYRQSNMIEIPFIENRGEPLALELADFLAAVRDGGRPRVTGEAATRAVRVATSIVAAMTVSS
ncbi:MAG: Gfo/Idh/MocA family oxidoreductase [Ilumatobacter sp.]|nr:Gfo/Idh/MocA family oxidoreductase [Ilumatobacter sp.]